MPGLARRNACKTLAEILLTTDQWHNVPHLLRLLALVAEEPEVIGERLQTSGLPHCDGPVVHRVDVAAPVRIAFGEDGAAPPALRQSSVALRIVAFRARFMPAGSNLRRMSSQFPPSGTCRMRASVTKSTRFTTKSS